MSLSGTLLKHHGIMTLARKAYIGVKEPAIKVTTTFQNDRKKAFSVVVIIMSDFWAVIGM